DDEQKDDEKKDDEKKDQQDPQDQDPKDQQAPKPPPPPDQVDIDQLIDSLDQHEKNPQLEKALRMLRTPPPRMEDY
ncbi:MAG: hypothetical protein KC549_18660, partial [Myxococcales bacterium]|nr:hypothetical protein [Myxococcales bacterium]